MEEFWIQADKGGGGSWKLNNSHGRHRCIPNILESLVSVRHFARYVIMNVPYFTLICYLYYFLKRLF